MDINERIEIYRLHAEFCKALSDANRLLIIAELSRGELSVNELTHRLGLQQSNVSKHLGFHERKRSGQRPARRVFYLLQSFRSQNI